MGMFTAHYAVEGEVLWDPVNSISAPCCLSHLAFAISCVLDCYLLAGSRTLLCPRSLGITDPNIKRLVIPFSHSINRRCRRFYDCTWEAVTGVLDVKNSFLWGHQGYGTLN